MPFDHCHYSMVLDYWIAELTICSKHGSFLVHFQTFRLHQTKLCCALLQNFCAYSGDKGSALVVSCRITCHTRVRIVKVTQFKNYRD